MDVLDQEELLALARIDVENNALSDALVKLKYANRLSSDDECLAMLARVYARIGLFTKAKAHFEQFLSRNSEALVEKFQYGMTHFDSNDDENALKVFQEILQSQKDHPPALYYSALIYSRKLENNKAIQNLELLLSTAPKENLFYLQADELLSNITGSSDDHNKTDSLNTSTLNSENDALLN